MQTGDEALAGRDEINITHRFPPDNINNRTIWFKGYYLSIYNQQTEDYKTHMVNASPTTEYERYEVPAGYTIYVRVATVKFEV
jgi:hypothetical protein